MPNKRCPLCGALRHIEVRQTHLRCRLCSLVFSKICGALPAIDSYIGKDGSFYFPNWNNWLSRATGNSFIKDLTQFNFAPVTVRMFAAQHGRYVSSLRSNLPLTSVYVGWAFGEMMQAHIEDKRGTGAKSQLTLGIIASTSARQEAAALSASMAEFVDEVIIVLDTADDGVAAELQDALRVALGPSCKMRSSVIAHPLNGDFASQRNRVQEAARTEWVLQLDTDEYLTPSTKAFLPNLIHDAERGGWDVVGLLRLNLVDGIVSALYPDVQYRLVRSSIRYIRPVHEYPRVESHHAQFTHLGAEIVHTINSSRLSVREAVYNDIQAGADRPEDTALLRRPLEPGVRQTA